MSAPDTNPRRTLADDPIVSQPTRSRVPRRLAALVGLAAVGGIATAAFAGPPNRMSRSARSLEGRIAALEAARTTEHRRRDFVIWQNRTAIRGLIDATASAAKPAHPSLGTATAPPSTKDRACCFPPKTSFLVCDDLHPIDCKKKGGTLAPGQSQTTAVSCGVGVCGIQGADQSAPGWDELFGSGAP